MPKHESNLPALGGLRQHRLAAAIAGLTSLAAALAQSLVRSDEHRRRLFVLDQSIQALRSRLHDSAETLRLTNVYHNLLRQRAEPA